MRRTVVFATILLTMMTTLLAKDSSPLQSSDSLSPTYVETLQWLRRAGGNLKGESIKWLFCHGDERIGDLIRALREDLQTAFTAETIIRYLGNPKGMSAVIDRSRAQSVLESRWKVVPVPLNDWDYEHIERFINEPVDLWAQIPGQPSYDALNYVYPLALDRSPKAEIYLQEIIKKTARLERTGSLILRHIDSLQYWDPKRILADAKDPENIVKPIFLNRIYDDSFRVRMVAKTIKEDKALIKVNLVNGLLDGLAYDVVLVKNAGGWRCLSVTLAGIS